MLFSNLSPSIPVFSSLFRKAALRVKRIRQVQPLHTHHDDVRLLQRIHGRFLPRLQQLRHLRRVLSKTEMRLLRVSALVFVIGLVWLGIDIGRRYRVVVPAIGGRYVEAVIGTPELINPVFASVNDVDTDIARLIYTGLMRYDEKQRLIPDLAVSYALSEDKKTYTFELRRDVVWHDGEALSARDVVFTIETIQHPVVGSPLLVSFQGVAVTAVDDDTVQFVLKEPFAPFLGALTVGIIPEHIWADVPGERMRLHKNNLQAVGAGPFQFDKLLKDDTGYIYQYELVRNTRYYRQSPYIEEFVFQFFGEFEGPTGAIQAMREQKVQGLSFVPHELKDKVQRKHITLHTLQLPQYTALFFNADREEALRAKELRTALDMALDKDRILRDALSGEGEVIHSPILVGYPGYSTEIPKTAYNLEEANKLLDGISTRLSAKEYRELRREEIAKEFSATSTSSTAPMAASIDSGDSAPMVEDRLRTEINEAQVFFRKLKSSAILELTLVTADTPEYKQASELIAGFWQDVGVKTVIQHVSPKDIRRLALKSREYDVLLYSLIVGSDPDQYPFWHSSQVDFPGLNLSRYVNRSVDALLTKAREMITGDNAAGEVYKKIQEQILADRPVIFLYTPTYTYATNNEVFGITATRIFHPSDRLNAVATWYIKTDGQWKRK